MVVSAMRVIDITTEQIKGGIPARFDWYESVRFVEIPVLVVTEE